MAFRPYPIVDVRTGLQNNLEPWLIPKDAFVKLNNAYLWQGYITKRRGYKLFTNVSSNPIMGIYIFYTTDSSFLIAMDTTDLYKYDGTSFSSIYSGFTGSDKDYFWTELWQDKMVITNNHDLVKKFDGTNVTNLSSDSGLFTGGNNYVTKALILKQFKGRMIAFNTYETSDGLRAQRARWSAVGSIDDWQEADGGGYVDADTAEWITGVVFLKNRLIVWFEQSVWELEYTGNEMQPFVWNRIDSSAGCYAPFSVMDFSDSVMAVGGTDLNVCNGYSTDTALKKIPDFVLKINPDNIGSVYSVALDEMRQIWWAYPEDTSTTNNKVLVYNYREDNFSVFDIPACTFGFWNNDTTPTWDAYANSYPAGTTIDQTDDVSWDELGKLMVAGYPTTLMGGYDGNIYQLNTGSVDNGNSIPFEVVTKRMNPFLPYKKAVLGFVDFLVSTHSTATLTVELYNDTSDTPSITKTLDFTGNNEKVWKRLWFNKAAKFHQLRLYHNQKNATVKIHAIVPNFKPVGVI